MVEKLNQHLQEIKEFNQQRLCWLRLSGFVTIVAVLIFLDWDDIVSNKYIWVMFISGITLAIVWWYWTMTLIRKLLTHKQHETEILSDIVQEIKAIRTNVAENFNNRT